MKLILGDCLEKMKDIEDGSVDMILTDPPYGTTDCKWDSVILFDPMWEQLKRIIKSNGAIVMTASQPFTTTLIASNMKMFKYCWVWDKQSGGTFVIAKYRPLQTTEDIVIFGKGKITYNPQMTDAQIKNIRPINLGSSPSATFSIASGIAKSDKTYDPKKRYPKTLISISRYSAECNSRHRIHPTQKPISLMEYLIKTYTNENDTVLDFAMGSGTTGVACKNLNRKFIGIEKDKKYFQIAQDRIDKHILPANIEN